MRCPVRGLPSQNEVCRKHAHGRHLPPDALATRYIADEAVRSHRALATKTARLALSRLDWGAGCRVMSGRISPLFSGLANRHAAAQLCPGACGPPHLRASCDAD
ncbi:hypothetical protein NDU88_001460 [Pleurodeles waltl]|uniref:Uncharacterized protein n=1 Tax=Pleurodeles waltl TaxID=8319 RepID=A0AAV7U6J0_PLEWA|nr:hypothetical protein NDU88_001460 [Pleurodeles waltl]